MIDFAPTTLEQLARVLTEELARDPRGRGVAGLMAGYAATGEDWSRYVHFRPDGYTRNLVEVNEAFELIVLCWDTGQVSPIHNHEGQSCWMAVLQGPMEEVHYGEPRGPGIPPVEGPTRRFEHGQVTFIHDDIALHAVCATPAGQAVSLHLYAKPIRECNCYCPETGRITRKALAYDTVHGEPARS